jgi:Cytidylate kinase-like family
MAFIAVSGEAGCQGEELARIAAQRLSCELVTEQTLELMMATRFGAVGLIPDQAWRPLAVSILVNLGLDHPHLVVCCIGAEILTRDLPSGFRFHVVAPESTRLDNLTAEFQLNRADAKTRLRKMASLQAEIRKRRFGQKGSPATSFDMVLNAQAMGADGMVDVLASAVRSRGLLEAAPFSASDAAQVQVQVRLQLARSGLADYVAASPDLVRVERKVFCHPSEEVFANLLDFYRIAWDYEPRSFPLQWDKDGKVSEAFTPDFYLPEFDLYVELTTMKQANVTKKNRKIRLLRAIYPHVNIQVFYQKDVQDLVMKYRRTERLAQ